MARGDNSADRIVADARAAIRQADRAIREQEQLKARMVKVVALLELDRRPGGRGLVAARTAAAYAAPAKAGTRRQQIEQLLLEQPGLGMPEIAAAIGTNGKATHSELWRMMTHGLVQRSGTRRNYAYQLTELGEQAARR